MAQRDGKNSIQVVLAGVLTLSGTSTVSTDWVDTRGFDKVTFATINNTVTDAGTASGFSYVVEESDDTAAANATAVADAELIGTEAALTVTSDAADDQVAGGIGYVGDARYVRLSATGTTGSSAVVNVVAVLSGASNEPPTFAGTGVAAT
jgi:hypothetical protein